MMMMMMMKEGLERKERWKARQVVERETQNAQSIINTLTWPIRSMTLTKMINIHSKDQDLLLISKSPSSKSKHSLVSLLHHEREPYSAQRRQGKITSSHPTVSPNLSLNSEPLKKGHNK